MERLDSNTLPAEKAEAVKSDQTDLVRSIQANNKDNLRVLIDMDSTICDLEDSFLKEFKRKYKDLAFIPLEERKTFYLSEQYNALLGIDIREKIDAIFEEEGFFHNLPVIEGAVEALKKMDAMEGVDVFLCTTPLHNTTYQSASEKLQWVREHLGQEWMERKTILTPDKTVVSGDILIDDRPIINGCVSKPTWDHILFTACHNKHIDIERSPGATTSKRRLKDWISSEWEDLIAEYLTKHRNKESL